MSSSYSSTDNKLGSYRLSVWTACVLITLLSLACSTPLSGQTTVTTSGGTANTVPKFTGFSIIGNSSITESGGNVGIGTTSPTTTLDVNGGAVFRSFGTTLTTTGNNGPQMIFSNAATPTAANWRVGIPGIPNSTDFFIYDFANLIAPLTIEQGAASDSVYLKSGGYVGIGTATPAYKLDVNGDLRIQGSGRLRFPDGSSQGTAALGTITGVLPGTGLIGGGSSGNVTLSVDSNVARTNGTNTFTAQQTFTSMPLLINNTALIVDNEYASQYAVKSTVLSGIAAGFWNKAWYDTSWATGSIIAGWAGNGMTQMFHVDTRGTTYTYNGYVAGGYDYAELVNTASTSDSPYEVGDVLEIDPTAPSRFVLSSKPYSTLVAGVFSSNPGVVASPHPMQAALNNGEVPLGLLGQVTCKVSSENGLISIGDLLVTSSTPGYAMRAGNDPKPGTILGKALEPLASVSGKIKILLTLQ